jgi:hypothetical protein
MPLSGRSVAGKRAAEAIATPRRPWTITCKEAMTVGPFSHDDELAELRHHWGDAYQIERTGPQTWLAARRDGRGAVHANTADELFQAISNDYLARPVPRTGNTFPGGDGDVA